LSAASQQQLFCQLLPNSNCFVSSFPTAILFCQLLPNSNCFVSSFPTAIVSPQARLLAAACNSSQQVDARIVSTHQQATAISQPLATAIISLKTRLFSSSLPQPSAA
jgi:hypothetical protein